MTTSHSILTLDTATGETRVVHRGLGLYYGLTPYGKGWLVAARGRLVSAATPPWDERGQILVLDAALREQARWQAPFPLRDMHGIGWYRGRLWITCSFDDLVAVRDRWGHWRRWYPLGSPPADNPDVHHFNSLYFEAGRVWVVAHNRGPSEMLAFDLEDAQRGRTTAPLRRLALGEQAHDLWRENGELRTCSSGEGLLRGTAGWRLVTGGFPRGILRLDQGWAVGLSALAERHERDLSTGEVVIFDAGWREHRRWSLPGEGLILALARLEAPGHPPLVSSIRRIWQWGLRLKTPFQ